MPAPFLSLLFATTACAQVQDPEPVTHPANHLVNETSPYLLQHANNPVDWYPWGDEALRRAKDENKPIFLSIGYSACHWCHVMEHESFEDEEVAAYMNEHFINIKVDREERPDLDDIYMAAVQRMTGSGGWPMSVWLTPDLKPFYGGTYFPPLGKYQRPGFLDVLTGLKDAWENRHDEIVAAANSLTEALVVEFPPLDEKTALVDLEELIKQEASWVGSLRASFDEIDGGFGQAPKFPRAEDLRFLLAAAQRHAGSEAGRHASEMALFTLSKMASGGMYDRLAGGFSRYSVDGQWLIPHFEKMLYDQGTLVPAYLEGWRLSGDSYYEGIARQSCDYLLREMQAPGGGFYSSTDADSEGEEGKFFVWTPEQLTELLGEQNGAFAAALYGVTKEGNFEHGTSALRAAMSPVNAAEAAGITFDVAADTDAGSAAAPAAALAEEVRAVLYTARLERIPPATDDKILTAWNGLAIDALAQAGRTLGEERYTAAAAEAANFLLTNLRAEDGRLLRAYREGKAQHSAVLEDYAYLCRALLSLFQSTGETRWLEQAQEIATRMVDDFWDQESGIFFDTDGRDEQLLQRLQQPWDGAIPSANAVALESLLKLHALTQDRQWLEPAQRGCKALYPMLMRNPRSFSTSLRLFRWAVTEPAVAVVVGTGERASLGAWRVNLNAPQYFDTLPILMPSAAVQSELGLFADRPAIDGKATLYLCEGQSCQLPRTDS
ncbi:MAG: thioredoxin domain-containing protein [Planctomycetes bacterium]|nr:thioredoxin domain-containing protein [Planctomycetota bacterium]MCP4769927.1 thioredoxin domain-containing protein [Planctomycetota bacterium]MCP4859767.1 thioredoxin domain-containing protein [Planctomycetota bacterium]